ncbi:MAG: DUF4270 domain-containing protein, partial [Bacteroidales bacterium]|nr:DUF4270 domain-containing protein [Bacteroidales bacterium]
STVFAYSLPDDSIKTDEKSKSLLGSVMDPVFGSSVAGIYSQFKLSVSGQDFGENPVLDSLVLQLYYNGSSYGDTNTPLVVHAYEMLEGIDFLEDYYSNTVIPVASTDYANFEFVPRPKDSLVIDGDTLPPMLRIRLSDASTDLGYKFLNADTSVLSNSDAFVEFFKGLYLVTEPVSEGGSISYFDLISRYSTLILYYQNDTTDSLSFDFIIDQFTPRFNKFEHDFAKGSSEFKAQVINRDTSLGVQKFYTQGIAGVKSIVRFPKIRNWARLGNIAINEAKLVLSGYEEDPYNGAPPLLALVEIQEDGTYLPLIDEQEGAFFFDGNYKSSTNSYTFRVTRHVQSLISDTTKPNNGMYLFVRGESVIPERFVFNGPQPEADTALPFRLEIIYTELK